MNAGTENRKKTIAAGALGVGALIAVFFLYTELFGGSSPAPPKPPVITSDPGSATQSTAAAGATSAGGSSASAGVVTGSNANAGMGVAPGVAAMKLVSNSSSLDPTLDQVAMLRTESLVYSGSGRNIFSATYTPPVALPTHVPPARTHVAPPPLPPAPPVPPGPPPLPPINLKFFGTARYGDGHLQGFFLSGDDVYVANQGEIVARKYKIVSIQGMSAQVEDLQNNNVQSLPLQMQ